LSKLPSNHREADRRIFSLLGRVLEAGKFPASTEMVQPVTDNPTLDVRGWSGGYEPTLNGRSLVMRPHEQALALTFFPDGRSFVLGTIWYIRRIDATGHVLWETPVPYGARGLVVTQVGHLVVTAVGDGTIRWYAADTGRELLAFFPHLDGQRWITWTRSGITANFIWNLCWWRSAVTPCNRHVPF
jgi:hypothetical protein